MGAKRGRAAALGALAAALGSCIVPRPASRVEITVGRDGTATLRTPAAEFVADEAGCLRGRLIARGRPLSLDDGSGREDCEATAAFDGGEPRPVQLDLSRARISAMDARSRDGAGRRIVIPGHLVPSAVDVTLSIESHDSSPNAVSTTWTLQNAGATTTTLDRLFLARRRLSASDAEAGAPSQGLWSFHGSSERVGQEEVARVLPGLKRRNAMGLPGSQGVGGGVPVVAFWSAAVGTALGHLAPGPVDVSLPVEVDDDGRVHVGVLLEPAARLDPGEPFSTPRFFHTVFTGDYYEALRVYSRLLGAQGPESPSAESYEPSWCSWGYGEDVTPERMLGIMPKLEDLGIRWATLDDRWFDAFGDWQPRAPAFSIESIQRVVDAYHSRGMKLQIWWVPLAVETGRTLPRGTTQEEARVWRQHPDWLILDRQGRPAHGVRGLSILCPAVAAVRDYHRMLVRRFIREWGFDGHKLDAVFTIPRCYNPAHHHASPDESLDAFPALYEAILAETHALKADAVVQICSCGTPPHHAWLPFLTQAVAADPWGSVQRRQRIKMYKALLGPRAAVSGDHVELAERRSEAGDESAPGRDFASTVGIGGVPSTRFVWPSAPPGSGDVLLTAEKESRYRRWLEVYRETRLSEGTFRNLYVYGFDEPEAYCVEKDGRMYYAFFTPDPDGSFEGSVELRGLAKGRYSVEAYVRGASLGTVEGPTARIDVRFTGHLLLVAKPEGT
jgi:alpha-galactosidase